MTPFNRSASVRPIRLKLQELESRLVPSADPLDLTARGSAGVINEAIFRQSDAQPTGSGVIHSFVRIQSNAATEQGYNTGARPLQFDENKSPVFTRALQVGDAPLVSVGGVLYREFLLDINQKASAPLLSLDELRLYVGDAPNLTGYDAATKQLAGLNPVYDMDAGADHSVKLNYRLNSGSGSGDMTVLVRADLFGSDGSKYVYLYSAFGQNQANNSGFEEWAVRAKPSAAAPPPGGFASLAGTVYFDANQNGIFDAGDSGIAGVTMTLNGMDDAGQNVILTTTTDALGQYSFTGLRPGTYTLIETQPQGYEDGQDCVGTQGGHELVNDQFTDIFLAAGVKGENNNFGELIHAGS